MSSPRRIAASRANGAKSRGPVTPEGKARSATNATRHGLASSVHRLADSLCLTIEARAELLDLHQAHVDEFAPTSRAEELIVEEMTAARWRMQRAWVMETYLLENQMDRMTTDLARDYDSMIEPVRLTLAFRELSDKSPSQSVLHRYENRLSRQLDRCLKRLTALRAGRPPVPEAPSSPPILPELVNVPNEPNPKNEHSPVAAAEAPVQPAPAAGTEAAAPLSTPAAGAQQPQQQPVAVSTAHAAPEVQLLSGGRQRTDRETSAPTPPALPRVA